jgi:serine/threonine-protein kinase RsbW
MELQTGLPNMGKTFPAHLKNLYEMLAFIGEQAKETGFHAGIISQIELACEEALVNIISYGYPEYRGNIEIMCFNLDTKGIKIIIKDHGIPFNPLSVGKKSTGVSSNGGYGVFFILKLMDEVSYSREDNCNILSLIKLLA